MHLQILLFCIVSHPLFSISMCNKDSKEVLYKYTMWSLGRVQVFRHIIYPHGQNTYRSPSVGSPVVLLRSSDSLTLTLTPNVRTPKTQNSGGSARSSEEWILTFKFRNSECRNSECRNSECRNSRG